MAIHAEFLTGAPRGARVCLFLAPELVEASKAPAPEGHVIGKIQASRRDDLGYQLVLDRGPAAPRAELRVDDRTQVTLRGALGGTEKRAQGLKVGMVVCVRLDSSGLRALSVDVLDTLGQTAF